MSIYKKISSVWTPMQYVYRKASGLWRSDINKVYVKYGGSWRVIHEKVAIPTGLIVPSYVSAPTGWSNFTAANGYYIIGASSTYTPGTYGAGNGAQNLYTSYSGNHSGSYANYSNISSSAGASAAGTHRHYFTVSYTPPYQDLYLIKAGAGLYGIPVSAYVMSYSGAVGFGLTNATGSNLMLRANSGTGTGGSDSITGLSSDTQGSHNHGSGAGGASSGKSTGRKAANAGGHAHTGYSATVTNSLYKGKLSFWYNPTYPFDLRPGMIALWESLTPPSGWYFCDGNNGTPNLQHRYVKIVTSGSEGYEGDGTITVAGANLSHGNHDHDGGSTACTGATNAYHAASNNHPAHTFSNNFTWAPPYYFLSFIMKA